MKLVICLDYILCIRNLNNSTIGRPQSYQIYLFSVYAAFVHLSKLYSLRKAPRPSTFKVNNTSNFKCVGLAVHRLGHTKCSFIKLSGTYNYFKKFWDLNLKTSGYRQDAQLSKFLQKQWCYQQRAGLPNSYK